MVIRGRVSGVSQFGEVACLAVEMVQEGKEVDPEKAWKKAAEKIIPSAESQKKGCPRYAFLGLAEEGLIIGVSPGNYTHSRDNKSYALAGVNLLREKPDLCNNPREMWDCIMHGTQKMPNNQMDVVAALWKNGDIRHDA